MPEQLVPPHDMTRLIFANRELPRRNAICPRTNLIEMGVFYSDTSWPTTPIACTTIARWLFDLIVTIRPATEELEARLKDTGESGYSMNSVTPRLAHWVRAIRRTTAVIGSICDCRFRT